MTILFRSLLLVASLSSVMFFLKKIRKSKIQIDDCLFWVVIAFIGVILSFFPTILIFFSELLGIQSPTNLLYLVLLFALIIRDFHLTVKVSQLQMKLNVLGQKLSIDEFNKNN